MRRILIALTVLAGMSLPAMSADQRFVGTWKITAAAAAPWQDPDNPIIDAGEADYIGQIVVIGPDSITGPDLLGCGKTGMTGLDLPYASLFEGGLSLDPKDPTKFDVDKAPKLAAELGFTAEPVASLTTGCSPITMHLRDPVSILFGLSNRVFTMIRQ